MEQHDSTKFSAERLFFAAEIAAAWPKALPQGRLIKPEFRHMTLAFLGMKDRRDYMDPLKPSWKFPPAGVFEKWIFLPEETPHVVAAVPKFLEGEKDLLEYQKKLGGGNFLPHVSVSRDPFDKEAWEKFPCKIPFFIRGIALYRNNLKNRESGKEGHQNSHSERATIAERQGASENANFDENPTLLEPDSSGCFGIYKSLGHSEYELLWGHQSLAPFEEIEHTADIAYKIRGENFAQLALHSVLALSFSYPAFLKYLEKIPRVASARDIVSLLNRWIAEIDIAEGIGLKAVSYHATIEGNDLLEWTMIVDV